MIDCYYAEKMILDSDESYRCTHGFESAFYLCSFCHPLTFCSAGTRIDSLSPLPHWRLNYYFLPYSHQNYPHHLHLSIDPSIADCPHPSTGKDRFLIGFRLAKTINSTIIIMWFLRTAEELSVGLKSPVEDSPFLLSPHIPDCRLCYFAERSFFCDSRQFFCV